MSIKTAFRDYRRLGKNGIVCFALLTAGMAYTLSLPDLKLFSTEKLGLFLFGFYFVCKGAFILNQAQEWRLDKKMDRTKNRPIPRGGITPFNAFLLSFVFLLFGLGVLSLLKPLTAGLSLLAVALYNGLYTFFLKKRFSEGAVIAGALPGALPPVIGCSLGEGGVFGAVSVYLFGLLFLWQMPHFWSLALHYKEDYKKAGFPVLPARAGAQTTLLRIGCYMPAYIGMTLISPLFLKTAYISLGCAIFFGALLLYQFYKFFHNHSSRRLKFFLWVNASILVYFTAPIADKYFL